MLTQTSACSRFVVPLAALALVACAGSGARPAAAPTTSTTTTTGASIDVGAKPAPLAPAAPSTPAAPMSPLEGACIEGEPRGGLTDRVSCLESCRGYDDTAPMGSQCLSQYADCSMKCEANFLRGP